MLPSGLKNHKLSKKIRYRIISIAMIFGLSFLLIGLRGIILHLSHNPRLARLAQTQYQRRVIVAPKRGSILDRHGETLAIDVQVDSVYASPHLLKKPKKAAKKIAEILSLDKKNLLKKFQNKKKKFVWIKRRITQQQSQNIKNLNISGIGTLPEYKRFYPNGSLGANLLGAAGYDAQALSGLELSLDQELKSQAPPLLVKKDAKGRSYASYALVDREEPPQVRLTLDKTIQHITERELKQAVKTSKAKSGVAIVLEAKTGAILAMATQPSFDPNHYSKFSTSLWRNRAINDVFEPGSTFKAITAAAALETKTIDLEKKIHCQNGAMKVGSNTIHDHQGYGLLNLAEIIKYSSNICTYKLAQRIGKKRFYEYIKNFGFGKKSGIKAPGEAPGLMVPLKRIVPIQLGTIGFGQGISTTPLQLTMAYGALANGGQLMKPWIIDALMDAKGKVLKQYHPTPLRQVIQVETAQKTLDFLKQAVEPGGTGTQAALAAYSVGGKTGTAQKVIEGKKGYAKNKYVASFVGLAPVSQPKLVVLVSIDEPQGTYYGGLVSAPVFREIMGKSLAYLKIPADQKLESQKEIKIAKQTKTKSQLASIAPLPGGERARKSGEGPPLETNTKIPKLTGLSVREVLRKTQNSLYKIKIVGSGICNHQEPAAGSDPADVEAISLTCKPPI